VESSFFTLDVLQSGATLLTCLACPIHFLFLAPLPSALLCVIPSRDCADSEQVSAAVAASEAVIHVLVTVNITFQHMPCTCEGSGRHRGMLQPTCKVVSSLHAVGPRLLHPTMLDGWAQQQA